MSAFGQPRSPSTIHASPKGGARDEPSWWLPTLLATLVAALYLGWAYHTAGGQPAVIFHVGDPKQGTGYDGQFVYFMARDPNPRTVQAHLDIPAYRYQRILLPWLAHLLAGGDPQRVLWAVWGINTLAYLGGLLLWADWLRRWRVSPWWALLYGLWPGLLLPLRLGMPEPLAYGLALAGMALAQRRRWLAAALVFALALLTKETVLPFVLAAALAAGWPGKGEMWFWRRQSRHQNHIFSSPAWLLLGGALLPWLVWQGWLWATFGRPGVGLGGLGATPPPPVPFGGLLEVFLRLPPAYAALYALAFGPAILIPLALSLVWAVRRLRANAGDLWGWLLAWQGLLAAALPMGSWDPFAAPRVLLGLLVPFWAVALQERRLPLLRRLAPFWAALLALTLAK